MEGRRYRNRVEFKAYVEFEELETENVDIETEWNLKPTSTGGHWASNSVDIETEWNLKDGVCDLCGDNWE